MRPYVPAKHGNSEHGYGVGIGRAKNSKVQRHGTEAYICLWVVSMRLPEDN